MLDQHETIAVDDRVRLVQLHAEDAPGLFRLTDSNRDYLSEFLPWVPRVQVVGDSLKHIEKTLAERSEGTTYTYGIEYEGKLVGDISLRNINDVSRTEIGYWIARDYAGKGIVTRAVQGLTAFGLETLGLERIMIRAVPGNGASNRVAEKAGYVFVGVFADEDHAALNVWEIRGGVDGAN